MSGNLAKEQRITIISLSVVTFFLALLWIVNENFKVCENINLEPIVTSFASFIPVVSLWWPFKPKYKSKRKSGSLLIDMYNRDEIEIGDGDYKFIPRMSHNSDTSQHFYVRFNPSVVGSAIINDASYFEDVKDASSYGVNDKDKSPDIGDIIVIKNRYNKYALIKITSIEKNKGNAKGYEVGVDYVINTTGGVNFS